MPIVTETDVGKHNSDLGVSAGRIIEGGSWKRQRCIILLPSAAMISAKVALSHWNLIFPPNQPVFRMLCLGMEVGDAYQSAIDGILAHPELSQWEYVVTIEADNMPPQDGLTKLLRRMEMHPEFSCIGGLYWTKGPGGVPQIWGDPADPYPNYRPQAPVPGQMVECCGTAMGFNVWRLSMFRELAERKVERPWFKTTSTQAEGVGTQDLYFWTKVRPLGYRCAIDCDVLVGHHDVTADLTW